MTEKDAGMTEKDAGMTEKDAGMTEKDAGMTNSKCYMKRSDLIFTALLVPVDYLMLILAGLAAYFLRTSEFVSQWRPVFFELDLPLGKYLEIVLLTALLWLVFFALNGLYQFGKRKLADDFFRIITASSAGLMAIIAYIFISGEFFNSRFIILAAWLFAILFVFLGRVLVKKIQEYLIGKYNFGVSKLLVIGDDKAVEEVVSEINDFPERGWRIAGRVSNLDLAAIREILENIPDIEQVVLGTINNSSEKVMGLIDFCQEKRIDFKFVPNLFQTMTTTNLAYDTLGPIPIIELRRTALGGWGRIIKRAIDIVVSILCLIIFSPVTAVVALVVKLDSPGPVFYKNMRVGPKKNFKVYKLRSMKIEYCVGEEYPSHESALALEGELAKKQNLRNGPVFKIGNDPRRTAIGKFLEKWSLDELPQFWNVLKGDMSLVGPRPHIPSQVANYQKHHMKVFNIKPGLTGLAQISGRSDLDFEEEVKLDAFYVENWSLLLDLIIMIKTPLVVFFGKHKS